MGSPNRRQIDGLGGAHPLTSKVGIVSASPRRDVDLDFLFAQLQPEDDTVDTTPNCGNMLAAVVPFAVASGLAQATAPTTTLRVHTVNTGMVCDITVETPDGASVNVEGDTRIDGVPGTGSPILINMLDTAGSVCASMLPTSATNDIIDGLTVTCIDNGMPMVLINAASLDRTGHETVDECNADDELKNRLETLRLAAGVAMGLGDVRAKSYPKMCLVAPPIAGGVIATRCFIPHVCHEAIGVLAAVTVATACVLNGTVAQPIAALSSDQRIHSISIEHPTGDFTVQLEQSAEDPMVIEKAGLVRTARLLMRGDVMIPASVWPTTTDDVPEPKASPTP
jgi:4-oxalomesaconate tautomerase